MVSVWSEPFDLTGRNPKRGFTNCGFWIRDGELYALAALRDTRDIAPSGEEPLLLAYQWDTRSGRFGDRQVMARDYFAQNIPQRTPGKDWLILGKSGHESWAAMKAAKGGVRSLDDWTIRDLPTGSLSRSLNGTPCQMDISLPIFVPGHSPTDAQLQHR
jgi:hypothetical protein